jgi:hypothetical protein
MQFKFILLDGSSAFHIIVSSLVFLTDFVDRELRQMTENIDSFSIVQTVTGGIRDNFLNAEQQKCTQLWAADQCKLSPET